MHIRISILAVWSTLDLTNDTHTRKYQIVLEVTLGLREKQSKISPFPNLCPSYLNKVQIYPVNPTNPDVLKFITKFL